MNKRKRASHIWDRHKDDWYVEPAWCSERLLEEEYFAGTIYDPACGVGTIVKAARRAGFSAGGGDIAKRHRSFRKEDFLKSTWLVQNIVSNPPFGIAEKFIHRAAATATRKYAIIFPTARLNAARWLQHYPLTRIYLLTPRPSMPPGEVVMRGEKAAGGKMDFCWLVFDQANRVNAPEVFWLHRDKGK